MTVTDLPVEGGFVRFPHNYIYLPISPQAKFLLVAFCAHADDRGASWCSYKQLGEIIQRSKASVSAYVKELQEAGLIKCKNQRYGNGYNYRLLITIVGWRDLLAHWAQLTESKKARRASERPAKASEARPEQEASACKHDQDTPKADAPPAQKTERRVQPAECKDPSGPITQIHQTQTPEVVWSNDDEIAWRKFRPDDTDPISVGHGTPSPALIQKVLDHQAWLASCLGLLAKSEAIEIAHGALTAFSGSRSLKASAADLTAAAETIAEIAKTPDAIAAAIAALGQAWQPHWRRLSSPEQIRLSCTAAAQACMPSLADRQRAGLFGSRAWVAKLHLEKPAQAPVATAPLQEQSAAA